MRPREALLRLSDSLSDSGFNLWDWIRQAELGMTHSQAELGNDRGGPYSPASTSAITGAWSDGRSHSRGVRSISQLRAFPRNSSDNKK